jgi:hypothetical protein
MTEEIIINDESLFVNIFYIIIDKYIYNLYFGVRNS